MGLYTRIQTIATAARSTVIRLGERTLYVALRTYYAVLELRDRANRADAEPESKPLRNPVNRLVEFYVSHMWPGPLETALPLEFADDNPKAETVKQRIEEVWRWSQWGTRKQYAAREFPLSGDLFIKVVGVSEPEDERRVYLQVLRSETVTELDIDERGIVKYIRIDVCKYRRNERGEKEPYTHTEEWTMGGYRIWNHDKGPAADLSQLGTPVSDGDLETVGTPGMIPIVHAKFRDVGEDRGMNCFFAALTKIDESDAMAARLHRTVFRFNSVLWAIERVASDSSGRPLPPPKITSDDSTTPTEVQLGQERMVSVNGSMKCLVPNINYADINQIVRDQVEDVTKDLPELLYYEAIRNDQIATSTLRIMLAPAVARLEEARGNGEVAISRANMIALTMAQNMEIPGFTAAEIGTYEDGSFAHTFKEREVIPMSRQEEADADKTEAEVDELKINMGIPLEFVLQQRGYTQEQIDEIKALRQKQQADQSTLADQLFNRSMARFNAGAGAVAPAAPAPAAPAN